MARIEEVMGDACAYSSGYGTAALPANASDGDLVMSAYPNLVIYPPVPQADDPVLPGGGGQAQAYYTPNVHSSSMATDGEHHNGTRSSTPLRRSATWSPSSEPAKRRTWAERRKKLQMSRDVAERRGHSKPFIKKTVYAWIDGAYVRVEPSLPPNPAATPAAWCPDPSWEDYAEFKTAGWVQNDKQVDDIAAALAKW